MKKCLNLGRDGVFLGSDQWQEQKMGGRNRVISGEGTYTRSQSAQNHALLAVGEVVEGCDAHSACEAACL